jgi:POT family proton-dependent oligopeptide transporter
MTAGTESVGGGGRDTSGWAGHPRGLSTLFFTEMWERFSYYGMRAFLILYMVHGLGFDDVHAGSVYGTYTGSVWFAAIFGGFIADRWLGHYRSVLVGGIIIALGHFTLAFHALPFFYAGLTCIVIGTGLLKPNVSTLVGSLYEQGDERRDAGFSIFYMGINFGAFIGPLIAGYLAQQVDWHLGFACAGVGMTLGLVQYVAGRQRLQPAVQRLGRPPRPLIDPRRPRIDLRHVLLEVLVAILPTLIRIPISLWRWLMSFTVQERKRIAAVVVFFLFATLFWAGYEQAGSTLNLFADRYVDLHLFGLKLYASWFVSIQALFVIILAPIFAWLWVRLGSRQPSSPAKFAWALLFMGLAFLLLMPAGSIAQGGVKVTPLWLVGAYFIEELGELSLSPVGLSVVTKLAPTRVVGLMMGVWFLSNAAGNKLAGWAAGFISRMPLTSLFGATAGAMLVAALVMFLLIKPVRSLMGGVH